MKKNKKLLAFAVAMAMSLSSLPTVWADDITVPSENSNAESLYTDMPAAEGDASSENIDADISVSESDVNSENIDADISSAEENTDTENAVGDEYGIALLSLMPLETKSGDVLIDRSSGIPSEFSNDKCFYVKEALKDILSQNGLFDASGEYSGKIVYSYDDDEYKSIGWNDVINPVDRIFSINHSEYGYIDSVHMYFILGGDQLNSKEIKVNMDVYLKYSGMNINDIEFEMFNGKGEEISTFNKYIDNYEQLENKYYYVSQGISKSKLEENEYPGLLITLPDGYSGDNVKVYEGLIYNETELSSSKDITSQIVNDGSEKTPYAMEHYNNYYGCFKDFTVVVEKNDGSTEYLPIKYNLNIHSNGVSIYPNKYQAYEGFYYNSSEIGIYGYIYSADSFDNINANVYSYYYDYNDGNSYGQQDVTKIAFACFGEYNSQEDAVKAGEKDVKEELFTYSGTKIDFSKCKDWTNGKTYLEDGTEVHIKIVTMTVVDIDGAVYHPSKYVGYSENISTLSDDTYFSITGAKASDGSIFNYHKITSDDDSYYKNGYQTVFILNSDDTSVNEEYISPLFINASNARIYIGNDVANESASSPLQISGESKVKFESGKAIQYSAASESGTHLKNYWVTFLTQQSGAKLFVNAVNNPDHYSENGLPQREIFLNAAYNYQHDILFANVGDEQLTGIKVKLSDDAVGVKLDEYWTVRDDSVGTLEPFTTTSYNMKNIAKIRLVPEDEDAFGEICGTLTISADGNEPVKIELSGIAGTPKIVTDKLYDGVKYVPYSCVIMTNSMYESNAMKFEVSGGKLPDGLKLLPNGELYGIPTKTGTYTFTVKATYNGNTVENSNEYSDEREYTLVIADNTDENVDAVNEDEQGYTLYERVTPNIIVYYNGMTGSYPNIDRIEADRNLFWSEGPYTDEFMEFYIDGIKLAMGDDYTAEEGSTKITILNQTFSHIDMGSKDIPHTLAAEFRTENKTKDLRRTAQNIYVEYVNIGEDNSDDSSNGSSSSGGSSSSSSNSSVTSNTITGKVSVSMTIVDADGNSIPALDLELHSEPKKASTDSNGFVKFESVEFGRHTLYVTDTATKKKVSSSFSIILGSNTKKDKSVITAAAGENIYMVMQYDGSKLEILSVGEDVSSASAAYSDDNMLWSSTCVNRLSKCEAFVIIISVIAAAVIIGKKRKA